MIYISEIESHGIHWEVSDEEGTLHMTTDNSNTAFITAVVIAKANSTNIIYQTIEWYNAQHEEE